MLWGYKLLLKRFLEQCSRTGSQETKDGYRRELRHFVRWRELIAHLLNTEPDWPWQKPTQKPSQKPSPSESITSRE